jgi:hypothetical protein
MTNADKLKNVVEERGINIQNAINASMLARFAEIGVLNQGTSNLIGDVVSKFICDYYKAIDEVPEPEDNSWGGIADVVIDCLVNQFNFVGEINFDIEEDKIFMKIPSGKCKICPIGVGGLELPGTYCPIPSMSAGFISHFLKDTKKMKVEIIDGKILKKIDSVCHYTLKEVSK